MKTNKTILNEFSIEELESRFEMKPWQVTICNGSECPPDLSK